MPSYTTNTLINLLMPSNAGEKNESEKDDSEDNRRDDGRDDEGTGGREEGQEDSDDSRSGQDNRKRILQDESIAILELQGRVSELEEEVKHLRSQSHLLFIIAFCALLAAFGLFLRLV